MTENDLDEIVAEKETGADLTETARKRFAPAAAFLKSDPGALRDFFELADILRDMTDMKRLLGTDNEMFKTLAAPASQRGIELFRGLSGRTKRNREMFVAIADIAEAYARRGEKPGARRA